VFGEGLQTRSFCYFDDLIGGLMRMMESPNEVTGPINLGNPDEFTILELAEAVLDLTGSRSKVVHRQLPEDDPRQRRPNISEAQRLLNWHPTVPLKKGLTATIAYFERLLADGTVERALSL
jgi:UDP-glucuronate decarboxylase